MANLNRPRRATLVNPELTPDLHSALVECRRTTRLFDTQVAIKCGVEAKTLKRWLTMGLSEEAVEPFASFTREYADAAIEVEDQALEEIREGKDAKAGGDWKATAWWLERWKPTRWGARVPESGPREDIDIQQLVEDAERRRETLLELFADPPPELEKAMRQNRDAILALLGADAPELPE
jgi:hypothetical protein